jgi:hypothetical protein
LAEIPSFVDKSSFFGAVLPGYVGVVLIVALFLPQFIPIQKTNDGSFSVDFFTAIVFIIAGPAVGYSVRQFHRYIYLIQGELPLRKKTNGKEKEVSIAEQTEESDREKDYRQYAEIRIKASEEEKKELDDAEAGYDFSVSTGIILITIAIFYMVNFKALLSWINISLIFLGIIFFVGAVIERNEVYSPLYFALVKKHKIK